MEAVFWMSVGVVIYAYFGYPLLLLVLSKVVKRTVKVQDITPRVTIIIPNYNEKKRIAQKLDNMLAVDYPRELMEIIVASDCSTDGSDDIVRSYADRGVKLVRQNERRGKHYVQGLALQEATADIIVFTDASILLPEDAIRKIVRNFADPTIGCVSSTDRILAEDGTVNTEGVYIRYDMLLRKLESVVGSSTGMSGSFYAARKVLCEDWIPNMSNDFYIPIRAVMGGYRAILDQEVFGYYRLVGSYKHEFIRKVRTIVHGLQVLFHYADIMNVFRYPFYSVEIISHKLGRWVVPFFMLWAFVTNIFLAGQSLFYYITMIAQAAFYVIAILAFIAPGFKSIMPVRIVYFFTMANASILWAWVRYLGGEMYESWEPSKR